LTTRLRSVVRSRCQRAGRDPRQRRWMWGGVRFRYGIQTLLHGSLAPPIQVPRLHEKGGTPPRCCNGRSDPLLGSFECCIESGNVVNDLASYEHLMSGRLLRSGHAVEESRCVGNADPSCNPTRLEFEESGVETAAVFVAQPCDITTSINQAHMG